VVVWTDSTPWLLVGGAFAWILLYIMVDRSYRNRWVLLAAAIGVAYLALSIYMEQLGDNKSISTPRWRRSLGLSTFTIP
jgi:hypothetical protein